MSKSGSRYGRRSNWFKIHCLLQQQQHQTGSGIATSAANLLRPYPYYPQLTASNPPTIDTRSSESDSGASSADPEDEIRSASAFSFFGPTISPSSDRSNASSNKVSSLSDNVQKNFSRTLSSLSAFNTPMPSGGLFTRWLPPLQNVVDPNSWRDLWLRNSIAIAEPVPEQDHPIDLSTRNKDSTLSIHTDSKTELNIDVGVEEPVKHVVPIDLTLDNSDKAGDIN